LSPKSNIFGGTLSKRSAAGLRLGVVLSVALALSACSSMSNLLDKGSSTSTEAAAASSDGIAPDLAAADQTEPVGPLYNKGLEQMQAGEYRTAAKTFGEVERQHPYSAWATKAQLMQAYAQYQRNAYDEAINAAQRFITLHPGHKDAAYAYYLVALCNYEQIIDVRRDQTNTQKALAALEEVSKRFPGTAYAQDAEAKATLARDHLAGKEMEVGRYYVKKGSYLAGINRFKRVITDYQTTSHTPEALYRLTEAYLALGIRSEAQTAAAVLGQNYPNSEWYQDAYSLLQNDGVLPQENKESWISKAVSSMNPF
jgi:outer membrane protein assembly factor BamD